MQAIETKYLSATNHRGERIKATSRAGSLTLGWDYELNAEQNHSAAAVALCNKFGWEWVGSRGVCLVSGVLSNGNHVHVIATSWSAFDDSSHISMGPVKEGRRS